MKNKFLELRQKYELDLEVLTKEWIHKVHDLDLILTIRTYTGYDDEGKYPTSHTYNWLTQKVFDKCPHDYKTNQKSEKQYDFFLKEELIKNKKIIQENELDIDMNLFLDSFDANSIFCMNGGECYMTYIKFNSDNAEKLYNYSHLDIATRKLY